MANKWRNTLNDADGNAFLSGAVALCVKRVDTTQAPYGTHPVGSYYSSRNGKFYIDGNECQPGLFSDAGGTTLYRTSWRNPLLNPTSATDGYGQGTIAPVLGSADTARITLTPNPLASHKWIYLDNYRTWCLIGDFDISVYLTNVVVTAYQLAYVLTIGTNFGSNYVLIERNCLNAGLHEFARYYTLNGVPGVWTGSGNIPATWMALRITRVGTTINTYYQTGISKADLDARIVVPGWVALGVGINVAGSIDTNPTYVRLQVVNDAAVNGRGSCDFTNFLINSGGATWSNYTGLARESFGVNRGNRDDIPENLVAVGTGGGLDLLDIDNNKLHTRFLRGANSILHIEGDNLQRAMNVDWLQSGKLQIAYGNTSSNSGGLIQCDPQQQSTLNISTSGYRTYDTSENLANGSLVHRNSGSGWNAYNTATKLVNDSVLDVCSYAASYAIGDFYYMIMATRGGLQISKVRFDQTYPLGGNPRTWSQCTELGEVYKVWVDPVTQVVYGLSATNMFSFPLADADTAMEIGFGDSISAPVANIQTLTKAGAVFPASLIGREIFVNNCANSVNNGLFIVTNAAGGNTIQYTNAAGVLEVSAFTWSVHGVFDSADSVALPGTYQAPIILHQHTFIVLSGVVYTCTNEGIYASTWPGAFSLMYGQAGSGATYRLPVYTRVTTMSLVYEGVTPYLMVTLWDAVANRSKILFIDPVTHLLDRYILSDVANGEVTSVDAL